MGYNWYCFKLWLKERPDKLAWFIAYKLPRKIALYAFVRVYATLGTCNNDYTQAYDNWKAGKGR